MTLEKRIDAFNQLGKRLTGLSSEEKSDLHSKVGNENPWFTPENVDLALTGISKYLSRQVLEKWTSRYSIEDQKSKKIGVAMAGNIPMVGFHDFLCVLLAGHQLVAKLSSHDSVLMTLLKKELIEINPDFADKIFFEERLNHVDAMIATGSDNTSRYFEYYFRNVPHIIRKNRSSCAIIVGEESADEFKLLGKDIFSYFGLGCRNVSKIYVPENFDFPRLLDNLQSFKPVIDHHKYANNYDYQKSILLINQVHFYDNGFLMLTESESLVSPISVVYYEAYKDQADLKSKLKVHEQKIQCIVSAKGWYKPSAPFGESQFPSVEDYADGVDTMAFLSTV